jgi:hypothetical protein
MSLSMSVVEVDSTRSLPVRRDRNTSRVPMMAVPIGNDLVLVAALILRPMLFAIHAPWFEKGAPSGSSIDSRL